ncbi:hypothetical protein FGO68_gene8895 [Halteria grandinella]|uniref:Cyclic nucleotide-binding domain-containing protein n=1 Tax=Halteria grandinella TaxID=5974 RepID=A0A8J8NU94_HALGN|nr:hypothetical protein FGO68_gene8895 [Halteria grandinella]
MLSDKAKQLKEANDLAASQQRIEGISMSESENETPQPTTQSQIKVTQSFKTPSVWMDSSTVDKKLERKEMESFESMKNLVFSWDPSAQQTLVLKKGGSVLDQQVSSEEISWEYREASQSQMDGLKAMQSSIDSRVIIERPSEEDMESVEYNNRGQRMASIASKTAFQRRDCFPADSMPDIPKAYSFLSQNLHHIISNIEHKPEPETASGGMGGEDAKLSVTIIPEEEQSVAGESVQPDEQIDTLCKKYKLKIEMNIRIQQAQKYKEERAISEKDKQLINNMPIRLRQAVTMQIYKKQFSSIRSLQGKDPSFIAWFILNAEPEFFMECEIIYRAGLRVTDILFLVEGHAMRSGYSGDRMYESGDVIVEESLYDQIGEKFDMNAKYLNELKALNDCHVWSLSMQNLQHMHQFFNEEFVALMGYSQTQ